MVLLSHPTGNANVAEVAAALNGEEMLAAYYTCVHWRPEAVYARMAPASVRAMFERRSRVRLPEKMVHSHPARELIRSALLRAGRRDLVTDLVTGERRLFSIDAVYRDLDRHVARELGRYSALSAVYAYEDGALAQFRAAEKRGLKRIYDLPIGYWRASRRIAEEEAERKPEWKGTLNALADSAEKCARKDEELELADTVIAPSAFVKETLEMFPGARKQIVVNPFGVPARIAVRRALTSRAEPLRVLYVGGLTQRKGIAYLFEAAEKLGKAITLTVIGRKAGASEALDRCCERFRWIESLPHERILAEMRAHDVFVFPSLFEGLALVNGEAISQGLPVITTRNSGGSEILRDGVDSFLVPIRDADAIAARLTALHEDRELLKRMSDQALERARELTWQGYRERTVAAVRAAITAE